MSDIGKVAKQKLEEINESIRLRTNLTQWKNTDSVIDWFNNLEQKQEAQFCILDIVNFYPSITMKLFNDALTFASSITLIDDVTVKIVANACKSLLFYNDEVWVKQNKGNNPADKTEEDPCLFDVTMGAYMGAQICDLVGLYILHQIDNKFPLLNLGLYRDDGLGVTYGLPGPSRARMMKDIAEVFKTNGLSITIDMGPKKAEFLDVVLDLETESYGPYRKPNSQPRYINMQSNHPPSVLKHVPASINKRLSKISSSKAKFDQCVGDYQQALESSGYRDVLKYDTKAKESSTNNEARKKRNRRRNITWWNPPFSLTVKTPIGRKFRSLINKHFKEDNPLKKIFNKNTLKMSYSCTKNMEAIIKSHTNKLMKEKSQEKSKEKKMCNCRGGQNECPLEGKCLTEALVYKAEIGEKVYYGSCGGTFKQRFYGHKQTFENPGAGQTALSSHIHENGLNWRAIKWSVHKKANPRPKGAKFCDVCLAEKLTLCDNIGKPSCLNFRRETGCKCPHKYKHLLAAVKTKE